MFFLFLFNFALVIGQKMCYTEAKELYGGFPI